MLMYLGILAKLLVNREHETIQESMTGRDKIFLSVLLDLLDRNDIQKLMKQHENTINLKKITEVLDLNGIKMLLSQSVSPALNFKDSDESSFSKHSRNESSNQNEDRSGKLEAPIRKFDLSSSQDNHSSYNFRKAQIIKMKIADS